IQVSCNLSGLPTSLGKHKSPLIPDGKSGLFCFCYGACSARVNGYLKRSQLSTFKPDNLL
ncbi:hypothetical protein, partial [Oligella urethralis]|uniref:hypothetical protein n=1 Tax=Oligella urethralis TaxID=90245 RepID=UPI0027B8C3E0